MELHITTILNYLKEQGYKYQYFGREDFHVNGFCSINNMKPNSITWIKHFARYDIKKIDKELKLLIVTDTSGSSVDIIEGYNVISCEKPKEIFFSIIKEYFDQTEAKSYISPSSIVETKRIGKNVSIGHNCYICKDVTIGNNVIIHNNVVIECKTSIGDNTIINSGVIIGTDGFGYYKIDDGSRIKVPQLGGVVIGSNVEIGGNTCIAKGTIDDTVIEDGVKIGMLCVISHNVLVQEKSNVFVQSIICGSCIIGREAYIAPGSLIRNQITIGEKGFVGMGSVVTKDVEPNTVVIGVPARFLRYNEELRGDA